MTEKLVTKHSIHMNVNIRDIYVSRIRVLQYISQSESVCGRGGVRFFKWISIRAVFLSAIVQKRSGGQVFPLGASSSSLLVFALTF